MTYQTQKNFIMFIIVLARHVSIRIGPSKKIDPYFKCLKMRCGFPNAYILDKTMYTIRTKRHRHFVHSFIKNVSVWNLILSKDLFS